MLYTVQPHDDMDLLLFNLGHCDVSVERVYPDIGKQRTTPTEQELEKLRERAREYAKDASFVPGLIFGMCAFQPYEPTCVYSAFEWLIERNHIPFVTLRTSEDCSRWYTEPGLGWVFYDEDEVPYKFCHPRDVARPGDYAIQAGRVTKQTYRYRGRNVRPKVTPVEEAVTY